MSSWLPKKYRNKGSLSNGERDVRTTCSDEMFITLGIDFAATEERSGNPPTAGARISGADAVCCGSNLGAAADSSAVRIRPVNTMPARKPDKTNTIDRSVR